MNTHRLVSAVLFLLGSGLYAQAPKIAEREDDLAALALHLKEDVKDVREAYAQNLEAAGDNRAEIEGAMERCGTRREKLVMIWLIAQMKDLSAIQRTEGEFGLAADLKTLKGELLHHNVRYALAARDRFPWCRDLPWSRFLHAVLPYRHGREKVEDFRPVFWKTLVPLVQDLKDDTEVLLAVNRWAAGKVKFKRAGGFQIQGILETLESGEGGRVDMANFIIACATTVGIPCASVYTPWWARKDGNLAWNEAYLSGRWRSFRGCEPVKEGESPFDKIGKTELVAKVYRSRFPHAEGEDARFGEDVTSAYSPVASLTLEVPKASEVVRLAVWNSGGWREVARRTSDEAKKVTFKNLGCRKPYLVMPFFEGERAEPAGGPYIFKTDGSVEKLQVSEITPGAQDLKPTRIDGLMPDATYGLLYFNGERWNLLGRGTARFSGDVKFGQVGRPKTLYVLVRIFGERTIPEGRPFLLEFPEGKLVRKNY
ncbi:MAG: transglutaminase-like domain-containing protein [Planctomycetota bacterium]